MAQAAQVQVAQAAPVNVEADVPYSFLLDGIGGLFSNIFALGDSRFVSGLIVVLLLSVLFMLYSNRKVIQSTHKLHHDDVKNVLQNLWGMESAIKTYIMESRSYRPKNELVLPPEIQQNISSMSEHHMRLEKEMDELLTHIRNAVAGDDGDGKDDKDAKDAQNRLESRLEAIVEQIKADRRDENNAAEIVDKLRDIMERQGVYLHDEFAAISDKISALQNAAPRTGHLEQRDTPVSGTAVSEAAISDITDRLRELREIMERRVATMGSGVGQPVAADSGVGQAAVLEMLTQSMNRLSSEVDAKLTLLNERLERNLSARWTDALGSINTLRSRLEEFSTAGDQMHTFNNNVASLSRMMMSRLGDGEEGGRQKLSELLSPLISSEHFSLDFDLPNGHCAAALVRFPDYNVCVDAGLSLQAFIESMDDKLSAAERDAKRDAFRRELTSQVNHVADHLIMPPHTGESALMFVASEAAFAEIHTRHRMVVQMALSRRVWIVSPTTFMAIINTANSAIRDRDAYARLREMQEKVVGIVEEVRGFENRLAEIGDHVNSAWRSIQRAEGAGNRLAGSIRDISRANDDRDIQSLSHDKSA